MELRDYLRTLRRRWRTITACVLLLVGAAVALTIAAPRTYESSTEVFVSLRQSDDGNLGAYQGNLFSQDRVKSYAQLVNSPTVLTPAIKQARLRVSPQQLGERVHAVVPTGTVLVDITVTDASPATARDTAAAVATSFARVVSDLEKGTARTSPVAVTIVRPADLQTDPVSPKPVLNVALGIALGLCLGVGLAVVREALDTTTKSVEDLTAVTGVPSLGEIGYDANASKAPLVTDQGASAARLEAFSTLRTNLRFVDVDNPPAVVVVTGPLEAEGKSTTACNLALSLAKSGVRVALVEGDLRRPRVADYLGLEGAAGLTDVLVGRQPLADMLQPWGDLPLVVLPSGPIPPNPSELLGSAAMRTMVDQLRDAADIVVIDAPPLLPVTDAAVLAQASDGVILAVRYGRTTREQVARAMAALETVKARTLGTVLTMVPPRVSPAHYGDSAYYGSTLVTVDFGAPGGRGSAPAGDKADGTAGSRPAAAAGARATSRRGRRRAG